MILALRTSEPSCEMYLLNQTGELISQQKWLAERRLAKELLGQLEKFIGENNIKFKDLKGLIIFRGPGSYTGLRIGASVMNTLAYALNITIIGQTGEQWLEQGQARLRVGLSDKIVALEYGASVRAAAAKK